MSKTLLIVDDNNSVASVLKKIFSLKFPEWAIVSFSSKAAGMHAVEWLESNKPEYAIVDVVINGINGIDVLKKIKDLNLDTKVVFLTGCDDNDTSLKKLGKFPEIPVLRKVASTDSILVALGLRSG